MTALPDPSLMEAAVAEYFAAFAAGDAARAAALFADNASVEDPVGSEPQRGHAAILAFYTRGMATGARLTLEGPVRICGDYAVFPFSALVEAEGAKMLVDVIDTFRFDANHKIIEMRAFFGPGNVHSLT